MPISSPNEAIHCPVVSLNFKSPLHYSKSIIVIGQSVWQVGVSTKNDIHHDVFFLVSHPLAMFNWCQNIDFVDCRPGEPKGIEGFNRFENSWERNRSLQDLDKLGRTVSLLERFESTVKDICEAKVQVAIELGASEVLFDKIIERLGIIQAVFVKESIYHTPAPRFDNFLVPLGQSDPEILEPLRCLLFVTKFVLAYYMSVDCSERYPRYNFVLRCNLME